MLPSKIILIFNSIVDLVVLIIDGHLVTYHIWLKRKGYSTFDHIMAKRMYLQMKEELNEGLIT